MDLEEMMYKMIQDGNLDMVKNIIKANPELLNHEPIKYDEWIFEAVMLEQINIVRFLLQYTADLNKRYGCLEQTLLEAALSCGNSELCKVILEEDILLDNYSTESSPLLSAVDNDMGDILEMLITKGMDIHHVFHLSFGDCNVYEYAVRKNKKEVLKVLERYFNNKISTREEKKFFIQREEIEKYIFDTCEYYYLHKNVHSRLSEEKVIEWIKGGILSTLPFIKELVSKKRIYGVAFELTNMVSTEYVDDFELIIYYADEDEYFHRIKGITEKKHQLEIRFGVWSEWNQKKIQTDELLTMRRNLLKYVAPRTVDFVNFSTPSTNSKEVDSWCEENDVIIDNLYLSDKKFISICLYKAIGLLFENAEWRTTLENVQTIPFEGENRVPKDELEVLYTTVFTNNKDKLYLEYLNM